MGRADEKFHSSSSAAFGAAGWEGKLEEARAANGSETGAAGGWKAECWELGGCGVLFCEVEGAELKAEKAENGGGGVGADAGPLALLSWVRDESKAGPGISAKSS